MHILLLSLYLAFSCILSNIIVPILYSTVFIILDHFGSRPFEFITQMNKYEKI